MKSDIKAIIFDFDGLMVDSESIDFNVWQEIYVSYGQELALDKWLAGIGSIDAFDPIDDLQNLVNTPLDRQAVLARHDQRVDELERELPLMPGVLPYIEAAQKAELKLGLGSSSGCARIVKHLTRLGIIDHFDSIICRDDVALTKPHPEIFELVLSELDVIPEQAIVLEDSPNGVKAAKRAGIFVVAVPCEITTNLSFEDADLRLDSLAKMPLETLLQRPNSNDDQR